MNQRDERYAKRRIRDVLKQNAEAILVLVELEKLLAILRLLKTRFADKQKEFQRFLSIKSFQTWKPWKWQRFYASIKGIEWKRDRCEWLSPRFCMRCHIPLIPIYQSAASFQNEITKDRDRIRRDWDWDWGH